VESARRELVAWDGRAGADSRVAPLYVLWERALAARMLEGMLDRSLAEDYARANREGVATLAGRLRPRAEVVASALEDAFDACVRAGCGPLQATWGSLHAVIFTHPLAVTTETRRRFNVGPFPVGGYAASLLSTTGSGLDVATGPSFREILDLADWDRSVATLAPGQSEWPESPHFADAATKWARGENFPLQFSDRAVQEGAVSTLSIVPSK